MMEEYLLETNPNNIVTDLIKALPGNGYVNAYQHATMEGKLCFLCGLRQATMEQRGFEICFLSTAR
jgi:hypothetical protein